MELQDGHIYRIRTSVTYKASVKANPRCGECPKTMVLIPDDDPPVMCVDPDGAVWLLHAGSERVKVPSLSVDDFIHLGVSSEDPVAE